MTTEHNTTKNTSADTTQQQATLRSEPPVLDTELLIKKYCSGGAKTVIEALPNPTRNGETLTETTTGRAREEVEYPINRDDEYTITRYRYRTGDSPSSIRSIIKQFDIRIVKDTNPELASHIESTVTKLNEIESLHSDIQELSTFSELTENAEVIQTYEKRYQMLQDIYHKNTLNETLIGSPTPREFEINQFPQGFYGIPHLYSSHANNVINDYLQEKDLGHDSVAWGSFIVEPKDFSEVYGLLKPFYMTPEKW
jgi:hypothetical protein